MTIGVTTDGSIVIAATIATEIEIAAITTVDTDLVVVGDAKSA